MKKLQGRNLLFYLLTVLLLYSCGQNVEEIIKLGDAEFDKGNFTEALSYYHQAVKLDDANYLCYYKRGYSYEKISAFEKAISDYNMAIELNPDFPMAFNNRGVLLSSMGNNELGIDDINTAITLDSTVAFFSIIEVSQNLIWNCMKSQ